MKNAIFAVEGIVRVVSVSNGVTVFLLDPVLPYRLDMTPCGGRLLSLLVRQGISLIKSMVLPNDSVGVIDTLVAFEYLGGGMSDGGRYRLIIAGEELVRYMSLPQGDISNIKVSQVMCIQGSARMA